MEAETANANALARRTLGRSAPWVLALVFAALMTPVVLGETWIGGKVEEGQPAAITLRVSPLRSSELAPGSAILVARAQKVDALAAKIVNERNPGNTGPWLGALMALFVGVLLWSSYLRQDHRGRLLRVQMVSLGLVGLLLVSASAALLFSSFSILAVPTSTVAFLVGRRSHRSLAIASALLAALVIALFLRADAGVFTILAVQGLVPAIVLPRHASLLRTGVVSLGAAVASALAYLLVYYAAFGSVPDLAGVARSSWIAAALGAPLGACFAQPLRPLYSWLCGDVASPTLRRLARLSQPLLRQIADKSPGTWQHSLAMANLAEAAGKSIGADLLLLRVGAYYHDIGKSLEPKYFLENLQGGETSVHQKLTPSASRTAIFAHVTAGIAAARQAGLPERVIDFIRSHHGGGLLEYFWTKGNEGQLEGESIDTFCYPGNRPQCPETGIMCICDALEAATRSLKSPGTDEIENIVDHILFGKIRAGQLDNCGLTLVELLCIRDALCVVLVEAHAPARSARVGADAISTANARPQAAASLKRRSASFGALHSIRLDSLDRPNASWGTPSKSAERPAADIGLAATENMDEEGPALAAQAKAESSSESLIDPITPVAPDEELDSEVGPEVSEADPGAELEADAKKAPEKASQKASQPDRAAGSGARAESGLRSEALPDPDSMQGATLSLGPAEPKPREPRKSSQEEVLLLKRPRRAGGSASQGDGNRPPPPPKRFTIPLGEGEPSVQPAQASRRADSEDGLKPGEMVVGAPPATHPERGVKRDRGSDDVTVIRPIPLPTEARRPEDRITEELELVPPEAYGEDTIPVTERPKSNSGDPESGL